MGKKSDNIEFMRRIRAVQEYILMEYTYTDIMRQCVLQWNVSEMQSKRYIKEAYKNWMEITNKQMDERRDYHIQARMRQIRNMTQEMKNNVQGQELILKIRKDIAAIEGLYVKRMEHTGKDGEPLNVSPVMSDEQFKRLLDEARKNKTTSSKGK